MSIGTSIVILVCFISKFANFATFLSGAIYSVVSIFEMLAHGYFIYLLYYVQLHTFFDPLMYVAMGSLGWMYVINFLAWITLCVVFNRDKRFKAWNKGTGNKITFGVVSLLGLFVNVKIVNILFTKIFNFTVFKAKLESVSKFFCLHFFCFLALVHSFSAIAAAGYTLYLLPETTRDQLFISCIDLIVVISLQIFMSVLNAHKG
jgi:hypothetical protein